MKCHLLLLHELFLLGVQFELITKFLVRMRLSSTPSLVLRFDTYHPLINIVVQVKCLLSPSGVDQILYHYRSQRKIDRTLVSCRLPKAILRF